MKTFALALSLALAGSAPQPAAPAPEPKCQFKRTDTVRRGLKAFTRYHYRCPSGTYWSLNKH